MNYVIHDREPAAVLRFFEQISAIPRGSYNEKGIADYLVGFAAERGLECYRDGTNNVFIKAPATPDRKGDAPILFQGHTDMVCEKNGDTVHDFLRDPLDLWVDGNLLRARGTTLGSDDGIAVATMLALLDGAVPSHPAMECLFTASEEVGLDGANAFDYSRIGARRMINMDSADLGIVTAGCAGGVRSDLVLNYKPEPFAGEALRVEIAGLAGGHSGEDINSGRANANRLMGRLLAELTEKTGARLVALSGGSKDNAIPREAAATLAVADYGKAETILTEAAVRLAAELSAEDRGFRVSVTEGEPETVMLPAEDTARALAVVNCAQVGVLEMSKQVKGLVEYSRNLGVIRQEEGKLTFLFSSRSSVEDQLDAAERELGLLARMTGCTVSHHSRYPGWAYAPTSPLRDAYCKAYRDVTGENATVNVIHAGLECGIIHSHLPDMDMISIAPTLLNIHSPDEAMDLNAVEIFWRVLLRYLETA